MWEETDPGLVQRGKLGDEKALSRILLDYTPLLRYIAGSLVEPSRPDYDDLLQEGYLALINSLPRYDEKRGKFSSFVFSCARNGMISFLRSNRKEKRIPFPEDLIDKGNFFDFLPAWYGEDIFDNLTCLETVVLDAFMETGSISRAACLLGWPRKKADNAIQRIRKKLRAKLEHEM
jgi:DNA-directed RNA polymerase specialized sigma24 family protein